MVTTGAKHMQAEIISIGSEITSGQIINTNARFLASELFCLGIESFFHTSVDDNIKRIHNTLGSALQRSDLIITTGGLGPTYDDLTHNAISTYFGKKLFLDKKYLKEIKYKFYLKGYKKMPDINKKQAYKPKDAKWIPNKIGTANGIIWKRKPNKIIITLPGVPHELEQMWNDTAKPYLKKLIKDSFFYSTILKYTGIGESALAEKINKFFKLQNPVVAPYANLGEVKIKITSRGKSQTAAKKLADSTSKKIITRTKKYYFGKDNESLESIVAKLLISKKKTISLAESCTGGLLSKRLTDISGSSNYIKLNAVTYSNDSKINFLKVPEKILKKYGAVSKQAAASMAHGIRQYANTDIGVSITGIAGPTGSSKEKPVGLVYVGFSSKNKTKTKKVMFGSNSTRDEIRFLATQFALNWIRKEICS